MVRCPCCDEVVAVRRTKRVTDYEAERAFRLMQRKGHTRESLLRNHTAALDFLAPGMVIWLLHQPPTRRALAAA